MTNRVNYSDIKDILGKINIIDIREEAIYNKSHLYNAINIPYTKLLVNHKKYLKEHLTYYIYCSFGTSSLRLANYLNTLGYDIISINEGYSKFKESR